MIVLLREKIRQLQTSTLRVIPLTNIDLCVGNMYYRNVRTLPLGSSPVLLKLRL